MGFKKYLDTDRANEVPELRDFAKYQTEIDNLKTLCVIIREEEKKFLIETKEEERNKLEIKVQALKNFVVIRLVGVSENMLKSGAADLIDEFELSAKFILEGDEFAFHLDKYDGGLENTTKGKYVITQFGLANAKSIGEIFKKINKIKESEEKKKKRKDTKVLNDMPFFDWLQDLLQIKIEEENLFKKIDSILKRRNDIAHTIENVNVSVEDLEADIKFMGQIIEVMYTTSFIHLSRDRKESREQIAFECERSFDLSIDKFYKIIDKHTKT